MAEIIEIDVSFQEIEARRERVEKAWNFETPDRVPCIPALAQRYLMRKVGADFRAYYRDPEVMLRTQILMQKWLFENIDTDAHRLTGAWLCAWTDFQNTPEACSLGCEIRFQEDDIPWTGPGWVRDDADLKILESMDFVRSGVNARQIAFREAMLNVAEKYPVRFQGGEVVFPGRHAALTCTSCGPFGVAGDLMGHDRIFLDCIERPDFVREVLRIVTDKIIQWLDFCIEEMALPARDIAWTDDLAVSLSKAMYRDLVLPFEKKLRFHFDGEASLHMCGRSDHLLRTFLEDLDIHAFTGFGYEVDLDAVARILGGKVVLVGNVNPVLILDGTPDRVREAARRVIETLAPLGGFILQDGSNIPPGAPVGNINALMDAARTWGRYD